jgi:fucose permease
VAADRGRWSVLVSWYLFAVFGVALGSVGVLLPVQMRGYHVDQATIGTTFVGNAVGFVLACFVAGPLGHRYGIRRTALAGTTVLVAAEALSATRPPLALLVAFAFVAGAATGLLQGILNAYLASLPRATSLLNRLHAFFGVGALLGPLIAAGLIEVTGWEAVLLTMAALAVPGVLGGWLTYPARESDPLLVASAASPAGPLAAEPIGGSRALLAVTRLAAVRWAGALLAVYVGLETAVGNWGYTYLADARSVSGLLAGYTTSAYWLGLTAGRFAATPAAARFALTPARLLSICMAGVAAACGLLWVAPGTAGLASASFVVLGFFLGPIFPTVMAVSPRMIPARLLATAIGALGAVAVGGGAVLPWLAGAVIQVAGAWTLPPFALVIALVQFALWRRLAPWVIAAEAAGPHAREPVTAAPAAD